ncbi:hypothetical protein [Candidatus Coxiella mudrowiae]|uniref:hypothetical protein n=1 Tax=Candidatus Coxiella mudrowiae TaxID=2054173 RepID=UPI0006623F2A|nr:hypothetical protein [Candidatus Coxiella mudrowiae]
MADIKLLKPISDSDGRALLKKPQAFSSQVKLEKSRLPYLSLKKLLDDARRDMLFKQIMVRLLKLFALIRICEIKLAPI